MAAMKVEGAELVGLVDLLSRAFCKRLQEEGSDEERAALEEQKETIEGLLKRNGDRLRDAYGVINEYIQMHRHFDDPVDLHKVIEELNGANVKAKSLSGEEDIQEKLIEAKTIAALTGLSEETLSCIYQMAYLLLDSNDIEKSYDLFWLLSTIHPFRHHYWLGVGVTAQQLGHHDEALQALGMAIGLDSEHPAAYYHCALSRLERGEQDEAKQMIELCLNCCENNAEYADWREQGVLLQQKIR